MNCGEFRRWFAILLAGGDAANWPEREYQLHSLRCPACQMLLATNDISQAVADVASMAGCSVDEMLIGEQVLRGIRRKMAFRRVFRRASVAVGVGVVILLALVFWSRGKAGEVPRSDPPRVAVMPKTPEEFARKLLTEDYQLRKASQVKTSRKLMFVFDRRNPDADQYEFVKAAALSGFEKEFPDAPLLTVSSVDEQGLNLLRVSVEREKLPRTDSYARGLPGAQFCRIFRVLNDMDGRSLPQKEDRE